MPVLTRSVTFDASTDALFRAFFQFWHDGFANGNWIQTSDTGQINLTTVTKPVAANTVAGYEVWRMDDALQATAPVFLKIEYGTGAANASTPGIWYTFGTGSDGSGTLTGTTTVRKQFVSPSNGGGTFTAMITSDTNRFAYVSNITTAAQTIFFYMFTVERSKDGSGQDTAEALMILAGVNSSMHQQAWPIGGAPQTVETIPNCMIPGNGTGSDGSVISVYPFFFDLGPFLNPMLNVLLTFQANVTTGVPVTVAMYGANHSYMPAAQSCISANIYAYNKGTNANLPILLFRNE